VNVARPIPLVILGLLLSAAALLGLAAPVQADEDTYCAIAYSESTAKWGYSYNYATQEEAEEEAIKQCEADDAKALTWARNGWCALALGDEGAYGYDWAETASAARAKAMKQCRKNGAHPHIVVCVSSDGEVQK
jgi:Domain of unknown function (DUF4189)